MGLGLSCKKQLVISFLSKGKPMLLMEQREEMLEQSPLEREGEVVEKHTLVQKRWYRTHGPAAGRSGHSA